MLGRAVKFRIDIKAAAGNQKPIGQIGIAFNRRVIVWQMHGHAAHGADRHGVIAAQRVIRMAFGIAGGAGFFPIQWNGNYGCSVQGG